MKRFSQELQELLSSSRPKTLKVLIADFSEKSFAILFLLLLSVPALPLPTGGVTHIFEIIALLLALELMAGRKTVWLPKRWLNKKLPEGLQTKALPKFIRIIRWIEKYSKPRLGRILQNMLVLRLVGLLIFIFTAFAFLAPPFSGLDTLPSLGVVLIALSLIFDDVILFLSGLMVGVIGIALVFLLGTVALSFL